MAQQQQLYKLYNTCVTSKQQTNCTSPHPITGTTNLIIATLETMREKMAQTEGPSKRGCSSINAVKKKLHQQNRPCTVLSKEHYTTQTEKVFENKLVLTSFSLSNIFDVWQQFLSSTKFAHFKVIQVGSQYANWESILELHKKTKVAPPDQSSILHSTTRFWMLE